LGVSLSIKEECCKIAAHCGKILDNDIRSSQDRQHMLLDYLRNELTERSRRNPRYSLRAFAKGLQIDSATLSALLSGRRPLTAKAAKKILDQIGLDYETRQRILVNTAGEVPREKKNYRVLADEIFEVISSWEYFAILSLLEIQPRRHRVSFIACKLNISTGTVVSALTRLENLGMVCRENGKWSNTGQSLATSTDVPSGALRAAHRQYIEKALYSLEQHSVQSRDITGITMAISKKKLPHAKRMIAEFRRNLCEFLESGDADRDEVYRLNVQLFPLGK